MMIGHEHKGKRPHAKYTLFILGNNDHMCLSILFSGVSIFCCLKSKSKLPSYIDTPIQSQRARELLARFSDTNFSYRSFLLTNTTPKKDLALVLQERFRLQKIVRDKIKERYTGPKEDVEKLSRMLDAFHKTLWQGCSMLPTSGGDTSVILIRRWILLIRLSKSQ